LLGKACHGLRGTAVALYFTGRLDVHVNAFDMI